MSDPSLVDTGPGPDSGFSTAYGFFTPEQYVAPYQLFQSRNRYVYESGLEMMPVAAPAAAAGTQAPASRVVRLAAPFGFRVFAWAVERQGKKPVLPDPTPQDPANEVLLLAEITPSPPDVDASASTHTYFVEGVYVYGLLRPLLNQNTLRMGTTPYDGTSDGENYYGPQDFQGFQ